MNKKKMKELGYQVIDYIVEHRTSMDQKRVFNMGTFDALSAFIEDDLPMQGKDPEKVFKVMNQLIDNNIVHTDHPRFFSFIPGPSNYYSVLAETLAVGYNVFSGHWMAGSIAGMIEKRTIDWLTKIFGYDERSGGIFLSGGSMANMSALVVARDNKLAGNFGKGTVYYSNQTHSSVSKALRIIGFTTDNMRKIDLDRDFKLDIEVLKETIEADIRAGYRPFCIIGNAGTTNTGAIDDLRELTVIAKQYNIWLHIDAAYGGAVMLSNQYKSALAGINLADSITLDPHKWWFQPYETGCLIVKDRQQLKKSFAVQAEYLDDTIRDEKEINFYDYGPQLTRSFRALKLFAFFQCEGLEKIGKQITQGIEYAAYVEEVLRRKDHWEIVTEASIGIVSFRAHPKGLKVDLDQLNAELSQHTLDDGYAMITTTKLNGNTVLRMCPIHPETTKGDIDLTVDIMNGYIEKVL